MSGLAQKPFRDAMIERRSIYSLGRTLPAGITDDRIVEFVNESVKHSPTAMNSQSSRAIVLLAAHHERFWDLVKEKLETLVDDDDSWKSTKEKLESFRAAYGTILLFEDYGVVEKWQEKVPLYKDQFPEWAEHAHGILSYVIWTGLQAEGLGVHFQHYNPVIDDKVQKEWNVPESWKLRGQLVFGEALESAGDKDFEPLDKRVKVFQ
ncbi:hypothetical protein JCM11491_003352 [Sporobolomyces phaffii]